MRRRGWVRRHNAGGGTDDRLDHVEDAVDRLREAAEGATIVIEGPRDRMALERLGIGGAHVLLNQGRPLDAVVDDLAQTAGPVILLVDWDRTGSRLLRRLETSLRARVRVDTDCRRRLASTCQARAFEEVPSELEALRLAAARGAHKG